MDNALEEVWKDYPEFPESYEVSSFGRVRGKDKTVLKSNGVLTSRKGVLLTPQWHSTDCWRVRLCVSGKKYSRYVHRMVAQTFLKNEHNLPEVNHLDGDRSNSRLENLEWVSKEANMKHAIETGLINNPFAKEARHFKRSVLVYRGNEYITTLNGNAEMEAFGLNFKNVSACLLGKEKTHRGYNFKALEKENI